MAHMRQRQDMYLPMRRRDGFCWPLTVRGAGKRAIFCKRMAGYAKVDEKLGIK